MRIVNDVYIENNKGDKFRVGDKVFMVVTGSRCITGKIDRIYYIDIDAMSIQRDDGSLTLIEMCDVVMMGRI